MVFLSFGSKQGGVPLKKLDTKLVETIVKYLGSHLRKIPVCVQRKGALYYLFSSLISLDFSILLHKLTYIKH